MNGTDKDLKDLEEFEPDTEVSEADEVDLYFAEADEFDGGEESDDSEDDSEDEDDEEEEEKKPFSDAHEWACSLVYAVLLMLGLNLFVFRSITVTGESMCDTLQDQDKVVTTDFFYTPDYGDIVVIQANQLVNDDSGLFGEAIIKRVIALAGDTIRFDFEQGEVYVNGELLDEDYIAQPTHLRLPGWTESGVDYVVPENCVFVMGDNRNRSRDSRDLEALGFVDRDLIMGKAILRVYPFEVFTAL